LLAGGSGTGPTLGGALSGGASTVGGASSGPLGTGGTSTPQEMTVTLAVSPGQDAQLQIPQGISVAVPGHALGEAATLVVSRSAIPPQTPPNVGQLEGAYQVELFGAKSHELLAPATLTFHVDPARLRKDVTAPEAAWVLYWDEQQNVLLEAPSTVDATAGTVTVQTNHFSNWWLYLLGPGDVSGTSPHFTYRFPAAINVAAWGTTDPFAVMAKARSRLESFFEAYVAAGFTPPSAKTTVQLRETYEAGYDPLMGDITISSYNYTSDASMLEHELAHELFHAFQGARLNLFSLNTRRWFVEAAADYAADAIASHSGRMGQDIDGLWSSQALGLVNGNHEYATSHFIAWLVTQRGIAFKKLQDAVFDTLLITDAGESAFATAAGGASGFARTLVDYIVWLETDATSPLASKPFEAMPLSDLHSEDVALDFASNTAPLVKAYSADTSWREPLDLIWEEPPAGVEYAVRFMPGGSRLLAIEPSSTYIPMTSGDGFLFVLAGNGKVDDSVKLLVEPTANSVFFSTDTLSGTVTDAALSIACTYEFFATGFYTRPYGTELVEATVTPCESSQALSCHAVTLTVRETVPDRRIRWTPSIDLHPTCSSGAYAGVKWQRDGAAYTNGDAFEVPASGATSVEQASLLLRGYDAASNPTDKQVLVAELQMRVVPAQPRL